MDKRRIPVRVVLGEGEGRTGDRFGDATGLGHALHQRGFPCSELALEEEDAAFGQTSGQVLSKRVCGLKGLKGPDTLCKVRFKRARSLGVSAEIHLHVSQGALTHGGSAHVPG